MNIKPIELRDANAFIALHHRHHKPVRGHRFSIQAIDENEQTCGVAIAGRPVARLSGHPLEVLEVTRVCTNGTKNACSKLYAAMARIAKQMGYKRIQTYVLQNETGVSLKAAGWQYETTTTGGQWKHTDGKYRRQDQPIGPKARWAKTL